MQHRRRIAQRDPALTARIVESFVLQGVRAGSALVEVGGRLLVVQDDALAVAWVTLGRGDAPPAVEPWALEGPGRALLKAEKPDFEAAIVGPGGAVVLLGSGSTPRRRRIARLEIAEGRAALLDAGTLYLALEGALGGAPNIEGAVLLGDVLRLFHRGSGAEPSATLDVPAAALDGGMARVLAMSSWDLGAVPSALAPGRLVPLSFTDAAPGADGRVYYLAAAEDTPNAVDDGPVAGAAVGVLRAGEARWTPLLEPDGTASIRKAEGVALAAGGGGGYLVTDPDDEGTPAALCRVLLEGPW
jgi:hypothetical protein